MGCRHRPHGHVQAFLDQIHHPVGQVQRHGQPVHPRAPAPPLMKEPRMFTTLAKVRIAHAQRFLDGVSTRGLQARQSHGSRGAHAFLLPDDPGTAMVLVDCAAPAGFDAFRADPAVKDTMRSGGALEPPVFTVLERSGSFPA